MQKVDFKLGSLALCSLSLLCACNLPFGKYTPSSQLDLEVRSAKRAELDVSAERSSEAMRRYLMAELSLEAERPDDALDDLKASSKLLGSPQPQIQIGLAQLYVSKGELGKALEALESIPEDAQSLALKAAVLQSSGRMPDALAAYHRLLLLAPGEIEARLMIALDSYQKREFAECITTLKNVIADDNKNLPALKLLAHAERESGNYDKAIETLKQLRQLDPGDQRTLALLLLTALENNKTDEVQRELSREAKIMQDSPVVREFAETDWRNPDSESGKNLIQKLKSAIETVPTSAELRFEMARLALLKQNFSEAVNHLSLLLAEKPDNDEIRYTLALALSSNLRVKEATSCLQQIKESSPWFVKAQAFSAMLYRQRADYKRAEAAFRRALKSDPKSEQLQFYLAATLREAKKYEEAQEVYLELIELKPDNQNTLFNYGVLLHEMKKFEESEAILQKLIAINPQHAEALNFISFNLAESGKDLERALDLVNRALQVQPQNGFFLDTRGWVYFRMGRTREAIVDLERAVDLSRGDAEISEHLADVYLHTGRLKEASQVYKDAFDNLVDSNEERDREAVQRIKIKIDELSKRIQQKTN